MMQNGIIPTYTVLCDPDAITANYITKTDTETKYLVASCCDEKVFEALKDQQILIWHCHSEEQSKELLTIEEDYQGVGGGCTVGLRSISIAMMLGYSNIHLYGFDSCLGENDKHHSYDFTDSTEEIGKIYDIKIGYRGPGERIFRCAGYQLAQASHFKEFISMYGDYFTPTFHGDGLLPHMMTLINQEIEILKKDNENVGI